MSRNPETSSILSASTFFEPVIHGDEAKPNSAPVISVFPPPPDHDPEEEQDFVLSKNENHSPPRAFPRFGQDKTKSPGIEPNRSKSLRLKSLRKNVQLAPEAKLEVEPPPAKNLECGCDVHLPIVIFEGKVPTRLNKAVRLFFDTKSKTASSRKYCNCSQRYNTDLSS